MISLIIYPHVPVDIIRVSCLISDFLAESLKKPNKKNFTYFTIKFCSKDLSHFTNLSSLDIEKYAPTTQPKTFLTLQTFGWCEK